MNKIDGLKFKEMLSAGAKALEINRATIDRLNVFPVPDGDTGTNMHLTLASAVREMNASGSLLIDEIAGAFASGALRGARGNSGVITSQIFSGFVPALEGKAQITPKLFAECLMKGTEIAYSAVLKPKEGTILTVVRMMAQEAQAASRGKRVEFEAFLKRIVDAGEDTLKKTPEMLPVLKKAGVVDAGGRGLVTIFDGMYRALVGLEPELLDGENGVTQCDVPENEQIESSDMLENDYEHITFQYCTEYFITHLFKEVTTAAIDKYRDYLTTIGDCVLVIGSTDLVKTHVHTNHPDRALNAALALGELDDVKIENMVEQHRKLHPEEEQNAELKDFGIVSVCSGQGMTDIFRDLGADVTVEGGQTMNPSVDDLLDAINRTHAKNVFVLPNNSNIILAAEQAKGLAKANIFVVPSSNMPEGIAAILAFDEEASAEDNFEAMKKSLVGVCCAEVTKAVRSARMNGYSVKEGDIIGINSGKIVAKNSTVEHVMLSMVKKLAHDKDILTLYYGNDVSEKEAQALLSKLSENFPDLETSCYFGGQQYYYYIVSLE